MKKLKQLILVPLLCAVLTYGLTTASVVSLVGCSGCGTLAPQGVYQGDKFLYDADLAITTGYEVLHRFVKWEFDNRAALASQPAVKQAADKVRKGAPQWIGSAIKLRDAYKADPTPANKSALEDILRTIRQAVVEATGYLAANEIKSETP